MLQEIRLESFFPADEATAARLAGDPGMIAGPAPCLPDQTSPAGRPGRIGSG